MKSELFLTLVTTIVAVLCIVFTSLQFRLAKKKRKDDLFNLRFEFYEKLSNIWTATYSKGNPPLDITDLILLSEKAEFLFGKDISKHIISLENRRSDQPLFPDDSFSKPFYKYLRLT